MVIFQSFQNYESTFQVEALGILQRFSSTGSTQPKNFHSRFFFVTKTKWVDFRL